ncbi:ParB N-terminal domain-containing protein [Streptomyces sp. NPDC096079]|uniref:ParB N-terminal domain-containing protein n=1 Tax=Streptomyces sp. NPDC096079 TaxID=3155820 RepID=UPI00332795B2
MTTATTNAKAPRKTKAPAPVWERLTVAELADQAAGVTPEADLTASVQADGVKDPLYIVTGDRDGGLRVVDGIRRLAAAVAAGCDTVPVTYRPVIPVAALTAHPGNVRKDLKITRMCASLRADGMRTPVSVTRTEHGSLRVTDGHRRLAAALAERWTHVPYVYDERSEADQYVDMVTTSVQREALTLAEEASALFAASELGTGVRRLAAASGRTQAEVKDVLRVGKSGAALAAATVKEGKKQPVSLEELGKLAELEELDPAAARRVTAYIEANPDSYVDYQITRELHAAQGRARAEAHRAELEAAGARIMLAAELGQSARPLHDLKGIKPEEHEACQGHAWVLEEGRTQYTPYCTSHTLFGHPVKATLTAGPQRTPAERKAIIEGGRDWDAAEERRREWLTKLISRRSHARALTDQLTAVTALAMIQGAYVMAAKLSHNDLPALVARFTGARDASTATLNTLAENGKRAAVNTFAVIAGCHEKAMPRTTWRTDADGEAIYTQNATRKTAARYLGWLVTLGFEPSPIERAVLDGETYDPAAHALAADEPATDELSADDE